MNMTRKRIKLVSSLFGIGLILTAGQVRSAELKLGENLPPVDFHGFLSQGFLYSGDYNYLGDSSHGSFKFTEVGLNASLNPFPRTRVSAQAFTFDVGPAGEYNVFLDYGLVEYTFGDYLGIRLGRIRRPEGIYNHIQDVDLARTWVLLPQGMYNARWRDAYASLDGGEFFGSIPLNKAGSLSYEAYSGLQRPRLNGGLALQKANLPPYWPLVWINAPTMYGVQLWWNTPLDGLRLGMAPNKVRDLSFRTVVKPGALRLSVGSPKVDKYSAEYLVGSWTFQAEYYHVTVDYANSGGGLPNNFKHIEPDCWYFGTAYRINKWVEAGGYYTEYYTDVHDRKGATLPVPADGYQKDIALSLRFDLNDAWIFKVEGHQMHGVAQLFDNVKNPTRSSSPWFMLAVKTTFSF